MYLLGGQVASATLISWILLGFGPTVAAKDYVPQPLKRDNDAYDQNRNGTPFVWLLEDDYKAPDFFDHFSFFTGEDPTHGLVYYVPEEEAFARKLAYISDDQKVIMKADTDTTLKLGDWRASVRVETKKQYTTGLFILDLNTAPWGCAIWPAWWSTNADWPKNGEIDIIEGVHDNEHNQVAWHTLPGCVMDTTESFSGNVSVKGQGPATNCDAAVNDNAGCSVTEWSRASYGPYFDSQGGGVFAMKWDENGIAVWSFYRSAVPADITSGNPNPRFWGKPSALLGPEGCKIEQFFRKHVIILNITFCGDWAGNSYSSTKCPGTCQERLTDPKNFVNASWSINSMKVYRKQVINAVIVDANSASSVSDVFNLDDWYSMAGAAAVAGIPLAAGYSLV